MFTSSNLLVPALIFVAVGLLAGVLIMTLVGDRRRRKEEADRSNPVMDDLIVPEMPALPESRFESIANLYRETRSGKLVTDVKGKVYLNRSSMPPEQLSHLQEAARNWSTWLGIPATEPPAPVPSTVSAAEAPTAAFVEAVEVEPTPAVEAPDVEAAAVAPEAEPVSTLPETEIENSSVESQSADMVNPEMAEEEPAEPAPADPVLTPAPPPPPILKTPVVRTGPLDKPRAKTMVGQIDDVLQEMLPETIYSGLNIHLGEEYTNGVVVWIGANKFIGIESVPDPEIKALIQSAVRKWEADEAKI
jgi:hypothetical protein